MGRSFGPFFSRTKGPQQIQKGLGDVSKKIQQIEPGLSQSSPLAPEITNHHNYGKRKGGNPRTFQSERAAVKHSLFTEAKREYGRQMQTTDIETQNQAMEEIPAKMKNGWINQRPGFYLNKTQYNAGQKNVNETK